MRSYNSDDHFNISQSIVLSERAHLRMGTIYTAPKEFRWLRHIINKSLCYEPGGSELHSRKKASSPTNHVVWFMKFTVSVDTPVNPVDINGDYATKVYSSAETRRRWRYYSLGDAFLRPITTINSIKQFLFIYFVLGGQTYCVV